MDTLCRQVVENCGAFETYVPLTQRILTRTQNKDNRLLATGSHEVSIQALASKMSRRAATRNRQAAARFPTPESIRTLNTEALQLHLNRYNLATTGKRQELVERLLQWYAASHRDVTEGFIVGLFFIQAPQEWMKANTKAFLNYTIFDMKKYVIRISFCSGSLCQMLFLEPSFSVLISWHAGVSFEDGNTYH